MIIVVESYVKQGKQGQTNIKSYMPGKGTQLIFLNIFNNGDQNDNIIISESQRKKQISF